MALGQTAGTSNTNQAGLNVKVTERGNDLPVQMATVYIVPQGDTVAVAFAFTDKKGSTPAVSCSNWKIRTECSDARI